MDTIVYLCYDRRSDGDAGIKWNIREHVPGDYRVIQVRVSEDADVITGVGRKAAQGMVWSRKYGWSLEKLGEKLRKRRYKRRQERVRQRTAEELKKELAPMLQENADNYVFYDNAVTKDSWIWGILPLPEFADFMENKWVGRLLSHASCHHFVVLGDAPCLQQVLWELAPRMKSLLWIAPDIEAREWLEDFAEDFYQDTGLAVRLQFLPKGTSYGQLTVSDTFIKEPVNILDFNRGGHIPRFWPREGSVWLDMASREDKERRMQARGMKCTLISLRKQWKNL